MNQELKDEINRLKKEQGVPIFPAKKDKESNETAGSGKEGERKKSRKRGNWNKGSKKSKIPIDRTEICVGTEVKDAFMSIVQTAARLDVSALEHIKDRISQRYEMTPLASLVQLAYT